MSSACRRFYGSGHFNVKAEPPSTASGRSKGVTIARITRSLFVLEEGSRMRGTCVVLMVAMACVIGAGLSAAQDLPAKNPLEGDADAIHARHGPVPSALRRTATAWTPRCSWSRPDAGVGVRPRPTTGCSTRCSNGVTGTDMPRRTRAVQRPGNVATAGVPAHAGGVRHDRCAARQCRERRTYLSRTARAATG